MQISYDTAYMWNLKRGTKELIYRTEIDPQTWKRNLWLSKGIAGGRREREIRTLGLRLLYIKKINKDLLHRTGNYIQFIMKTHDGKESEKGSMHI